MAEQPGTDDTVHRFLAEHTEAFLGQLSDWIRIPSVPDVPELARQVTRSARWLAGELRKTGFPTVELWAAGDSTAVYAEWLSAPGAPTVLIYSHHDVRSAKDENWDETAPFVPVERDGRLYGRGSSDAKGQVLAHLWGVRAHLAALGRNTPAVNLKLLVEGEEEAGSPHLAELMTSNRDRLSADLVLFSDTLLWRADFPAVCTSMRGGLTARLEVYGPKADVHSGAVSGPSPNPAEELSRLLAQLYDDQGRVTVGGFYDDVVELSPRRRAEFAALPFSEKDWLARSQTGGTVGEKGYTVLERLWARPAIEVLTLLAGDPAEASRAVIPAMAAADLSIRIVPGQTVPVVAEQLRRWAAEHIGKSVRYRLDVDEVLAGDPYETPEHPAVDALSRAIGRGFRAPTVGRMGNAGSGPAVLIATQADAPLLFFGTGLVEDNWHADDESARVDMLIAGAASLAFFWEELAAQG
jgi:acetylornithine deacetylase/succinyl-diaminopimelate desuccinylase-like protein